MTEVLRSALTLRMAPVGRVGLVIGVCGGALVLWAVLLGAVGNDVFGGVLTLLLLVLTPLAAIRLGRLGVDATAETITVRGYGRPRHIPIGSITDVQHRGMPRIVWRDAAGDTQRTAVQALRWDTRIPSANRRGERGTEELVDWIERYSPGSAGPKRKRQP